MITNPEDTGIFNPHIDEIVELVHDGGRHLPLRPGERQRHPRHHPGPRRRLRPLPVQPAQDVLVAALLDGDARRRVGGDGRAGAVSCRRRRSSSTARATSWTTTGRESIGKVRAFHGVPATVVRSYAWVLALGAEGLREVAEVAVLNNNYLAKRLEGVRGPGGAPTRRRTAPTGSSRSATAWRAAARGHGRRDARRRAAHRPTSASRSTSRATSRGSCPSR